MYRMSVAIALTSVAIIGAAALLAPASPPSVFSDMKFYDAKVASREREKLLIVDATATWCGPCQQMDKTTWVDPGVVSWIDEHAIAIQLDVDEERTGAQMLKIQAMPTIIVFKEGEEFDRVVGYRDAEQLLMWFDGVLEGRRDIDRLRDAAGDRAGEDSGVDIDARYKLAGTLLRRGDYDEATEEYLWLWENMLTYQPSMSGVRVSFMAGEMQQLCHHHEPAREQFTELRDALWLEMQSSADNSQIVADWVCLNAVIDDEDATLEWYDDVKDSAAGREIIDRVDYSLYQLLIKRKRWADAGNLYRDPVARAEWHISIMKRAEELTQDRRPTGRDEMVRTIERQQLRSELSRLYAACLAAERDKSARRIAELLLGDQNDEIARFALIEAALHAGAPRKAHLDMLEEAEAMGDRNEPLRRRLEAALQESDPDR